MLMCVFPNACVPLCQCMPVPVPVGAPCVRVLDVPVCGRGCPFPVKRPRVFLVCEWVCVVMFRGGASVDCIEGCGECVGGCVKERVGGCRVVVDAGLTPIEIIIGVVLLAVLSGVVVFQAFRFIAKADDSAASRSLKAAVTVVQVIGQLDASGGGGNLVGDSNPSTEVAITKLNEQLSGAELTTLEGFGVKLRGDGGSGWKASFAHVVGDAQSLWVNVPKNSTIPMQSISYSPTHSISGPRFAKGLELATHSNPNLGDPSNGYSVGSSFVEAEYPEFPNGYVYGFSVRPGNLVRVGVKSVSGATFCAISVKEGTVVGAEKDSDVNLTPGYQATAGSSLVPINGTGYQSVDAERTSTSVADSNAHRQGADCGAFWLKPQGDTATRKLGRYNEHIQKFFAAELPGLPGTDTRLMPPGPDSYAYS